MKTVLQLKFKDSAGKLSTISLDSPKEDLTDLQVNSAMNEILTQGVFETKNGNLAEKYAAQIVTTQVQEFVMNN